MLNTINKIFQEAKNWKSQNEEDLEKYRLKFLSKKGSLNELFEEFKKVSKEEKREFGQELNKLKNFLENRFIEFQDGITTSSSKEDTPDLFLSVGGNNLGSLHPLTLVKRRITEIFARMGFSSEDGPEIETDKYNFTSLNFPENHPAREMQDTFFVSKGENQTEDVLLRTHTSNVQVRLMESTKPPIRSIMI